MSDDEKARYAQELSKIFAHVEQLQELDVAGVQPTAHPLPMKNVFREDVVLPSLTNEEAVANAPQKEDGCFKVPPIV